MNFMARILWIKKNLFEILAILSLIFIILFAIYCFFTKNNGTWDNTFYYVPKRYKTSNNFTPKKDSNGELRTRAYLQKRFQRKFDKKRPDFMANQVTGSRYNLEFDCFNPELRLAVEYNGAQHYKYIPFFHKNKEAFYNQKYRDELKRIKCKDLGITLIEVPYTEEKHLERYLEEQLRANGY